PEHAQGLLLCAGAAEAKGRCEAKHAGGGHKLTTIKSAHENPPDYQISWPDFSCMEALRQARQRRISSGRMRLSDGYGRQGRSRRQTKRRVPKGHPPDVRKDDVSKISRAARWPPWRGLRCGRSRRFRWRHWA